jgi:hypothetical protein
MCFGHLFLYLLYIAVRSSRVQFPNVSDQKFGVGGVASKTFGCNSVDGDWDGYNVQSVMRLGNGSASRIITDDSETLGLDNLEFEVVGRTFGKADRSGVS